MLIPLIEMLYKKVSSLNHRLAHSEIMNMYKTYKPHYPWLAVDVLKGRLNCLYKKRYKPSNLPNETPTITTETSNLLPNETPMVAAALVSTAESTVSNDKDPHPTGRPVGTTTENMILIKKCVTTAQAEITHLYQQEINKSKALGYKNVSTGTFKTVVNNVVQKRNLPKDFSFPYNNMMKQIQRQTAIDNLGSPTAHQSPLRDCEQDIIKFIIKLGKIGSPLT
jgi:hypothetical protein